MANTDVSLIRAFNSDTDNHITQFLHLVWEQIVRSILFIYNYSFKYVLNNTKAYYIKYITCDMSITWLLIILLQI